MAVNPKKIDPNTIPPAARRAAEEADRLIAQSRGDPQNTPQPAPAAPEPAPQPPQAPPAPTHPEPAPGALTPPAPPSVPTVPPQEDWKARHDDMLNRNRGLAKKVSDLSNEVNDLRRMLSLVGQPSREPAAPAAPAEMHFETPKLLTPEEEKEWGEALPIIEKKAREIVAPLQKQLQSKIEEIDNRLKQSATHAMNSERLRMIEYLNSKPGLEDWQVLNNDADFVDNWLKQIDPFSRQTRHAMLKEAWDLNDAPRVAAFFEKYKEEVAATHPQPQPGNGAAAPAPAPERPSLERFAEPGRAHAGSPPVGTPDKPFFTTGDITRFFADKAAGRWRGREDEAVKYERALFDAGREGRVRDGPPQP